MLTVGPLLTKVSVLPFAIAALFVGWEYMVPIYFALYIWCSGDKFFYYPTPMAIERSSVKAMRISYIFTYLPAIGLTIWKPNFMSTTWAVAHILFPLVTYCCRKWIIRRGSAANRRKPGVFDNGYIGPVQLLLLLNIGMSLLIQTPQVRRDLYKSYGRAMMGYALPRDEARIISTDWAILIFLCFSLWDLKRVNISATGVFNGIYSILAVSFCLTPGGILMNNWIAREQSWDRARRISDTEDKKGIDGGPDRS
jgi:hypothetical protein